MIKAERYSNNLERFLSDDLKIEYSKPDFYLTEFDDNDKQLKFISLSVDELKELTLWANEMLEEVK